MDKKRLERRIFLSEHTRVVVKGPGRLATASKPSEVKEILRAYKVRGTDLAKQWNVSPDTANARMSDTSHHGRSWTNIVSAIEAAGGRVIIVMPEPSRAPISPKKRERDLSRLAEHKARKRRATKREEEYRLEVNIQRQKLGLKPKFRTATDIALLALHNAESPGS